MSVVGFLPSFLSCCVKGIAICNYYIVSAVGGWVVDGFVFANEEDGDTGGKAA